LGFSAHIRSLNDQKGANCNSVQSLLGLNPLIQPNGPVDIINITTDPKPEPFYNLHTTGEHNFTVDGMVVHNFTTLWTVRTWIDRSFIGPFH
jgi:hypothetical protein